MKCGSKSSYIATVWWIRLQNSQGITSQSLWLDYSMNVGWIIHIWDEGNDMIPVCQCVMIAVMIQNVMDDLVSMGKMSHVTYS